MEIDHIFIFTDASQAVVNELVSFGLKPNESRVHKGQGTTNRTFSFENFFLEIVWVHNEQEIKSALVQPTGLWQRAASLKNNCAPFGLILVNNEASDPLFRNAYKYQPEYFSEGMAFDIIQNNLHPGLPWTCRMPFRREKGAEKTVVNHGNKIKALTGATFQYRGNGSQNYLLFSNRKRQFNLVSQTKIG